MTSVDPAFDQLLAELAAGDEAAARLIYEQFIDQLVRLAASKLERRHGAKVDPETVVHSVFESFFERQRKGEFELYNWGIVFGLLAHITFRKCLNRNRNLYRFKQASGPVVDITDWPAPDGGPGPDDLAKLKELLALALYGFDEDERVILDGLLDGSSLAVVAEQVGLSTRTVRRVFDRFKTRLQDLLRSD